MHYLNDACYAERFKSVIYASISVRMLSAAMEVARHRLWILCKKQKNVKERPFCAKYQLFLAQVSRKSEVFPCSAEKEV